LGSIGFALSGSVLPFPFLTKEALSLGCVLEEVCCVNAREGDRKSTKASEKWVNFLVPVWRLADASTLEVESNLPAVSLVCPKDTSPWMRSSFFSRTVRSGSKTLSSWDIGCTPWGVLQALLQKPPAPTLSGICIGLPSPPGLSCFRGKLPRELPRLANLVKDTVLHNPVHPTIDRRVNTGGRDRGIYGGWFTTGPRCPRAPSMWSS